MSELRTSSAAASASGSGSADGLPKLFADAVESMHSVSLRTEITLGTIRPPQRLAPFSHAVGLEIEHPELDASSSMIPTHTDGDAFGRLILLHDPQGEETWDGDLRLVAYIQADMDASVAGDPLLPEVAWEWLSEGLDTHDAGYNNLGGTVTATASSRFGDIGGPPKAYQIELRASWTAADENLGPHVEAFAAVLANVAGLPPEGVATLGNGSSHT